MTDAPRLRVLRADDYHAKPWKNGQGTTRDILLLPEADDFDIRVSLADIPPESTFSAFPGITRHITLLSGDDMTLAFADGTMEQLKSLAPLTFDSAQTPFCRASGANVRVLNVMTRAPAWRSRVEVLAAGQHRAAPEDQGALLLFAVVGSWSAAAGNMFTACSQGETLIATGIAEVTLSGPPDAKALLARLTPEAGKSPLRFF